MEIVKIVQEGHSRTEEDALLFFSLNGYARIMYKDGTNEVFKDRNSLRITREIEPEEFFGSREKYESALKRCVF